MSQPADVSNIFGLLDEDEIGLIGQLADSLDRSSLDVLELEIQGLRVSLAKTTLPDPNQHVAVPVAPPLASANDAPAEDSVAITAPVIGFYRAQNGSGPIVTTGATVDKDTTIGVISQINTDRVVPAGINGIVTEICVENDQFVEYGQILCRVRTT
jgi:acetyl-CoA carboxylase biotin carboxyl carrier protein